MKYLKLLLFLCFINVYTLVYIWIDIIMQKNWVAKCKVQVQSVSHNLIKYTHGYLIAASKNQKVPFLDIQNQNPCVHLMPPSVGRNACGGFNFGCIKRVIFLFFDASLLFYSKPYFYVSRPSSTILYVFPPLFGSFLLHISCWDKVQPIIKSFLLKICLQNQIFLQELFF